MKILVCGGRDFNDIDLLDKTLHEIHDRGGHPYTNEITNLIHGCAKGADSLAAYWCRHTYTHSGNPIVEHRYPADWFKYGKAAGPIRNKQMLLEGKPDLVVAFKGGIGTANMVKIAREAQVAVEEVFQ